MVSWRLSRELHESAGFTSVSRLLSGAGMLVAVALAAQLLGSSWYMGRMLPDTMIGDQNVGNLTLPQARVKLESMAASYNVALSIGGQQYSFTPAQLGITYDVQTSIDGAYNRQRTTWFFAPGKRSSTLTYHINTPQLTAAIGAVADKIGTQPVNANLKVLNGQIVTVADKDGFTVDRVGLARLIEQNLGTGTPAHLATVPHREPAAILASSLAPSIAATKQLMNTQITLTYGTQVWTPTSAAIGSWLTFQPNDSSATAPVLEPVVDQTKLAAYVSGLAKQVDIAPVTQLETVTNGAVNISRIGVNGTAINQAAVVAAVSSAVMSQQALNYTITDGPVAYKTTVTNFTVLDLPSYVEINLKVQHMWVWQNGAIIYDSPVKSGATGAGYPTVEGMFHIYYKSTDTWLNGESMGPRYNYNDHVNYWMPFYSGYGMHDASWRNGNFGETSGPLGYWRDGSHGCVNLPDATAEWLYNWSVVGTPVWVHE